MRLTNIDQVQKLVGKLPAPRDLKVIDHVDEHAERWLSCTNFGFIAFGKDGHLRLTAVGGEAGFVSTIDARHINIPLASLDDFTVVASDLSFGALFMVSGMEETLRVNGKVSCLTDNAVSLEVEECYLHCAKAFRRSDFWLPQSVDNSLGEISDLLRQAKFLVLATINSSGKADVSPKGDPDNILVHEDELLCFADRPGNRRIDSFRNIMEQSAVCILALAPGCSNLLEISGTAELCDDESLLQRFAIQAKKPKLITKITPTSCLLYTSPSPRDRTRSRMPSSA